MTKQTTYSIATGWLRNNYILCNKIVDIDPSIFDNAVFEWDDTLEIYQYYLTDASEGDVDFLTKIFGLLFTYSDKLDCYVLCVPHCGTGWDYVSCDVLNPDFLEINPECEYTDSCNPPIIKTTRKIEKES